MEELHELAETRRRDRPWHFFGAGRSRETLRRSHRPPACALARSALECDRGSRAPMVRRSERFVGDRCATVSDSIGADDKADFCERPLHTPAKVAVPRSANAALRRNRVFPRESAIRHLCTR
jgi:hypothetical protein